MTVNKITTPPSQKGVIDKINEVIDNLGGGGTAPVWGNITGTLVDQTDLKNALDAKYDASNPNGYTSNVGTVTSVNNVSPVGGNVTLSIPSDTSDLTNGAGFITSSALSGYATETWVGQQGYALSSSLSSVATSGNYNDLTNKPTIPTVNDATLTIQKNGTTLGTFTANQSTNETINILADSVDVDGVTVSKNTDDELQAIGVIDSSDNTTAIKTWTGTKAEYDAIVSKDANTLYWVTDSKVIYLGDTAVGNFSSGRNVGEIISSTLPLTDAGLHLLDGSLIQGSGIYSAFVDYIAGLVSSYPDLFDTEANWQTSVSTYGVCGKFVYDSVANTVRLPKVTGIIEGTTDVTALGDLVEAGLPNITGTIAKLETELSSPKSVTGALSGTSETSGNLWSGTSSAYHITIDFDASRSNPIYGNSSTVQPQTIKAFYYIVIATSTKTDIQVDIDEIATDLNGKADVDLSNVPTSKGILTESYVNGTSWYRVYSDGRCEQGGEIIANGNIQTISLLKAYADKYYTLTMALRGNNNDGWSPSSAQVGEYISASASGHYSNSQFQFYGVTNRISANWQTAGYIN